MKHVIIIGAGVAGLTAGIYARRSGFDVTILEQHTIPGGMCTSWRRKGYLFEGGIHWMTGSSPKTALYELWEDVGALGKGVSVRFDEPFRSVAWEGEIIRLYRDPDKLRRHFDEVSPQDAEATKKLVSDIRSFTKMSMPITDIKGVKAANPHRMHMSDGLKMLPVIRKMGKISQMTVEEYASAFKHPALRMLINSIIPDEEYSATSLLFTLATLAAGDGGYPEGGSLDVAKRMAEKFTGLCGELRLGVKADRAAVKDGAAHGVIAGGKLLPADAVIITQDTIAAVDQLFDKPPQDEWLLKLKQETKPALCTFVSIGVKAELKETPLVTLGEPIMCGGFTYTMLGFNNYYGYAGYAPKGCTALTAFFGGDSYAYWKRARDEGRYEDEKRAVAQRVERALYEKFPETKGKLEVIDVATPLTYERYTGAWKGSWMSVMGRGKMVSMGSQCALEGVSGVYFAGQRTMRPGGLPAALMTGRSAAQMVCRQFGALFR